MAGKYSSVAEVCGIVKPHCHICTMEYLTDCLIAFSNSNMTSYNRRMVEVKWHVYLRSSYTERDAYSAL